MFGVSVSSNFCRLLGKTSIPSITSVQTQNEWRSIFRFVQIIWIVHYEHIRVAKQCRFEWIFFLFVAQRLVGSQDTECKKQKIFLWSPIHVLMLHKSRGLQRRPVKVFDCTPPFYNNRENLFHWRWIRLLRGLCYSKICMTRAPPFIFFVEFVQLLFLPHSWTANKVHNPTKVAKVFERELRSTACYNR